MAEALASSCICFWLLHVCQGTRTLCHFGLGSYLNSIMMEFVKRDKSS